MSARWRVIEGDLLRGRDAIDLGPEPFDAVLSDPPYEIGFMGKSWDASGVAYDSAMWRWVYERIRPGAPLLAFGGTRTHHRMMCAIEDADFEIRDVLSYLYGSGFPKSLNIAKSIDAAVERSGTHGAKVWEGYGTALKPSWEPVVLARRAPEGTMVENVMLHGVGGLAIDDCRIGYASPEDQAAMAAGVEAIRDRGGVMNNSWKNTSDLSGANPASPNGRWPANLLLDEEAAALLDEQSGDRSVSGTAKGRTLHRQTSPGFNGGAKGSTTTLICDTGGASRFFYTSKVSTTERNEGLDDLPELSALETTGRDPGSAGNGPRAGAARGAGAPRYRCSACGLHLGGGRAVTPCPKADEHDAVLIGYGEPAKNPHPTMKPVALTEYLAKLILPPRAIGRPRRLLVPFCGVASEMIGALRAGWDEIVGIELSPAYAAIARLRLARVDTTHQPTLFP